MTDNLLPDDDAGEGQALLSLLELRLRAPDGVDCVALAATTAAPVTPTEAVERRTTGHIPSLEAPAELDVAVRSFASRLSRAEA